jgi:outer membrane protein TolC
MTFKQYQLHHIHMLKTTLGASLVFVILLVSVNTAQAQVMSMDDCVRLAIQRNARLASAAYSIRAAVERTKETDALWKPSVALHAGAAFAPVTGYDPVLTEGGEYAGYVEVKQPIFNGGVTSLTQQQADVNLQQATVTKARKAADVRLDVRLAYINFLHAQRQLALTQESVKDLSSYLETVRSLANGGAVPKTDVMKIEIQLQAETIALKDLQIAVTSAMKRLVEPLGLPLDTGIVVQDTVVLPVVPEKFVDSPDLREFALNVASASLDVELARAERSPVISVFGSVGGWTSRNQLIESESPYIFGYRIGFDFDVPLWTWDAISAHIGQKDAILNSLRADFDALRRRYETEYQTSLRQYHVSMEKLELFKASRTKAVEQYEALQAKYAGGGLSSLEVLDAHRTLLTITLQEEQTRTESDLLRAQLLRLNGETE